MGIITVKNCFSEIYTVKVVNGGVWDVNYTTLQVEKGSRGGGNSKHWFRAKRAEVAEILVWLLTSVILI